MHNKFCTLLVKYLAINLGQTFYVNFNKIFNNTSLDTYIYLAIVKLTILKWKSSPLNGIRKKLE